MSMHVSAILRLKVKKKGATKMPVSFSVKVAAEECGLSQRTLHAAIKRGALKVMRVGRRVLITPAALDNFLNGRTGKSKAGVR